jgi:hypothetical protein
MVLCNLASINDRYGGQHELRNYYNSINVPSIATECFLFLFHSPQRVSAPTGHPQV